MGLPALALAATISATGRTQYDQTPRGVFLSKWLLSAVALMVVSTLVPGFVVQGFGPALVAALVIGLLNAPSDFS